MLGVEDKHIVIFCKFTATSKYSYPFPFYLENSRLLLNLVYNTLIGPMSDFLSRKEQGKHPSAVAKPNLKNI